MKNRNNTPLANTMNTDVSCFSPFLMMLSLLVAGFLTLTIHRITEVMVHVATKSISGMSMREGTSTDDDSNSGFDSDISATADAAIDVAAAKQLKSTKPFGSVCDIKKIPAIDISERERMWASAFRSVFGNTVGDFDNYLPRDWEAAENKDILSYAFNHLQVDPDVSAAPHLGIQLGLPPYLSFEIKIPDPDLLLDRCVAHCLHHSRVRLEYHHGRQYPAAQLDMCHPHPFGE